jgi:hypothetical protein
MSLTYKGYTIEIHTTQNIDADGGFAPYPLYVAHTDRFESEECKTEGEATQQVKEAIDAATS